MAIGTTNGYSGPYAANGVTVAFPFTFSVLSVDQVAVVTRTSGGVDTVVSSSSYTVSLNGTAPTTGTVTFTSAPASGLSVFVYLAPAFTQNLQFADGSAWLAKPVNDGYDAAALRDQALKARLDRTIIAPLGETGLVLPTAANRAGKFLAFDGAGNPTTATGGGGDSGLRTDIGASGGAALIGAATGGTVETAIWKKGRATPIAASKMAIRWLRDDASFPLENEAGIWGGAVVTDHGISATFASTDGQAGSPCAGLFVMANNNGSAGDIVGALVTSVARANNTTVFGANIIAQGSGKSGCKFVGLEIDVEPTLTDTALNTGSGGLWINAFNVTIPGAAIGIGSVGGGKFANGILIGGVASNGCALALDASGSVDSLINTTVGTFNGVAVTLGAAKNQGVKWTSGTATAYTWFDGSTIREVIASGAGGWAVRNSTDTSSLVSIGDTGSGGFLDASGTAGQIRVNGTKVVGTRSTGWGVATGGSKAALNGATATLAQTSAALAQVIADLTAHGLIGA